MKKLATTVKNTVNKLVKNKKASQTDAESKALQEAGRKMSAPTDNAALEKPISGQNS
jgi:hypothetical protein